MAKWTIGTLKALHEQRFRLIDQALRLQAEETARRLAILNHAHEKAVEVQNTYVPREVFDAYKETTSRALNLREGRTGGISSYTGVLLLGAGVLVAAVGLIFSFMR